MHDLDMNVCEFVFLSSVDLFISFMIYFSFKIICSMHGHIYGHIQLCET